MGDPKSEILDEWQERAGGWVKKIAIAPEREGAVDFIKHAKTKDIYVALAHTDVLTKIVKTPLKPVQTSSFTHTMECAAYITANQVSLVRHSHCQTYSTNSSATVTTLTQ